MGSLVPRKETQLAPPGDHAGFVRALDGILRAYLPADLNVEPVRIRLVAHASLACGWNKRTTWHYNYWGVRRGSGWLGDWYEAAGPEEIDGQTVIIPAKQSLWRAFPTPAAAVADTVARLRAQPEALAAALDPSPAGDLDYANARKKYGYWTANQGIMIPAVTDRCARVRRMMQGRGYDPIDLSRPGAGSDRAAIVLLVVLAAIVVGGILIARWAR